MSRHALRYHVVTDTDGTRRLICSVRGCSEGIVGARTAFNGAWRDGVHRSDFEAGNFTLANNGGYELQDPGLPL